MTARLAALCAAVCVSVDGSALAAEWPTLRGNVQRTGYVDAVIKPPFRLVWVRHFVGERIGSAVEPIVADGKAFIGTHSGNLYALDAQTGEPLWRERLVGPILHSPSYADGTLGVCADGEVAALGISMQRGTFWTHPVSGTVSCAAAPLIVEGRVFAVCREGQLHCMVPSETLPGGREGYSCLRGVQARQTPAYADGRLFLTGEDMRVICWDIEANRLVWRSEQLVGQTARDYYPVIASRGGRTVVVVRTNPVIEMSRLTVGQDRQMLSKNAGVDDSDWQKLEAWCRSEEALGSPELWEKEQAAICDYLAQHREAQTFFVLDAESGKVLAPPPVLWVGGCQGVGTPPVVMPDGRLLVFYRSAYGNWNNGVAPLVAIGLLDWEKNRIEPLTHAHGVQPPWNTFWGTADESQNVVVAGDTVIFVHQGTLSGFDLKTRELFSIWGERDSWGGFRNLPWARNEWHGPARGGVAIVGNRIYWQTGSRILCIAAGEMGDAAEDEAIDGASVFMPQRRDRKPALAVRLRSDLASLAAELFSGFWAPLYVEPGLSGREFQFDDSGETFEAVAWAFPYLDAQQQHAARAFLAAQWETHPPFARQAWYPLDVGKRREAFWVPTDVLQRHHADEPHHPFGNIHAVWLYAERCGEWDRVKAAWPQIKSSFDDFVNSDWKLDAEQGDLHANRYLGSLIAFAGIAEKVGDAHAARQAHALADRTSEALIAWWKSAAARVAPRIFAGIGEWDEFIVQGQGDGLFFKVRPHKSRVALFHDLAPEVAAMLKARAPEAVEKVWNAFEALCPTWYLVGEERQVHFGENFVDPPNCALNAFKAYAWLGDAKGEELARRVDIPCCKADLAHLVKVAITLEKQAAQEATNPCGPP